MPLSSWYRRLCGRRYAAPGRRSRQQRSCSPRAHGCSPSKIAHLLRLVLWGCSVARDPSRRCDTLLAKWVDVRVEPTVFDRIGEPAFGVGVQIGVAVVLIESLE